MTAAAFATLWHVQQVERDIAAAFVARDDPVAGKQCVSGCVPPSVP
jgi:hypothetical protein